MTAIAHARGAGGPAAHARRAQAPAREPTIPRSIWGDPRIQHRDRTFYGWFVDWTRSHPGRFPTMAEATAELGMSASTVSRARKALIGAGYIAPPPKRRGARDVVLALYVVAAGPALARRPVVEEQRPLFDDLDPPSGLTDFDVTDDADLGHPCASEPSSVTVPPAPPLKEYNPPPPEGGAGGFAPQGEGKIAEPMLVDRLVEAARKRFPREQGVRAFMGRLVAEHPAHAERAVEFAVLWKPAKGVGIARSKAGRWAAERATDDQIAAELDELRPAKPQARALAVAQVAAVEEKTSPADAVRGMAETLRTARMLKAATRESWLANIRQAVADGVVGPEVLEGLDDGFAAQDKPAAGRSRQTLPAAGPKTMTTPRDLTLNRSPGQELRRDPPRRTAPEGRDSGVISHVSTHRPEPSRAVRSACDPGVPGGAAGAARQGAGGSEAPPD